MIDAHVPLHNVFVLRENMWEVILDSLKDSAIALPFLIVIYLLIEFLESNERAKNKTVKLLNGKFAPLVASGVGLIPQCGFSVMATDLYCQNYLKTGTLIAFFVATSDEALPILLTNAKTVKIVWVVVLIKAVYAILLGFVINLFDKRKLDTQCNIVSKGCCHHPLSAEQEEHHQHDEQTKGQKFWNFVKHPLLHTFKIFLYIFVINTIFAFLLYYAEQPILQFTAKIGFWQNLILPLIGLIPNCASSVIITGMYTEGIISLSAMLAGLVANSGIALVILFRQKKWRNFAILGGLYLAGAVLGVVCYFLFPAVGLA